MADKVRYVLDRMAVLFQQLKHYGVFSAEEVKSIIQKRTDFEYMILRPELTVSEYESYLNYELHLDQLRELRTKKLLADNKSKEEINHLRIIRSSFIQHINYIYQRAVRRFPKELHLWDSQISFLQTKQSFALLNIALGRAIALFPKNISFWLKAAVLEIEEKRNFHGARLLIQRAIRVNARNPQLWLKAFEIETLQVIDVFEKRKEKLGTQYLENQPKDQETWKEDLLKPLSIVFRHACSTLLSSSSSTRHPADQDDNQSDVEVDEEEEEVAEERVESGYQQQASRNDCLEVIFSMHYLTLTLATSYQQWGLVEELSTHLESHYESISELWFHLLKFTIIRELTVKLLPLYSTPSSPADEEQSSFIILSLIPSGVTIVDKYEQSPSREDAILESLKTTLITIVFSCLGHHYRTSSSTTLSSDEEGGNHLELEWKEVLTSLQNYQSNQFLEKLTSMSFLDLQKFVSSSCKSLKKAPLQPILDAISRIQDKELTPINPDVFEYLSSDSSLTILRHLITRTHCTAFLRLLKVSLPASMSKAIIIDETVIMDHCYQWTLCLAKVMHRVERGLSLEWRQIIDESEVFASLWKEFSGLLLTLSSYQEFYPSKSWEEYLMKAKDSLLTLSVLLARWEESFPLLKMAVSSWFRDDSKNSTSANKQLKPEDEEDKEEGTRDNQITLSWKEEMAQRVLLNSHFTTAKMREDLLALSLTSLFEDDLAPLKSEVDEKKLERFFQRYTHYFDSYPQFFSLDLIHSFLQTFIHQFLDWKGLDHNEDVSLRAKRKLESADIASVDLLLQQILHKSSKYWKVADSKQVFPYESQLQKLTQQLVSRQNKKKKPKHQNLSLQKLQR